MNISSRTSIIIGIRRCPFDVTSLNSRDTLVPSSSWVRPGKMNSYTVSFKLHLVFQRFTETVRDLYQYHSDPVDQPCVTIIPFLLSLTSDLTFFLFD